MKTVNCVNEFLLSRSGLSPNTIQGYRQYLTWFMDSFPELPTKPQPIQALFASLDPKLTPESVHARFRTLRAFYRQICLWHPKVKNPMPLVRAPRLKPKAQRTFTNEELYKLFTQPLSARDRAIVSLMLDVGPRVSECVNLTWDDVIPYYVILRGKTGERQVPISDTTYNLLYFLKPIGINCGRQHVFQGKKGALTRQGIYKLIRRLCRKANITGRRSCPHTFRHTFGTHYASSANCNPKVLQDIMGHRDYKTTLGYIQNNPQRMAENHRICTPLKMLGNLAQGTLFDIETDMAMMEAQEILASSKKIPI